MTSREEWLERITFKREELVASFDGLSVSGWTASEVAPGWTAKDVLAHIVAWETRVATHLPGLLADQGMKMVGVQADAFNAEQVALRRSRTVRELLDELASSRQRILDTLTDASDDDLIKLRTVPWGQITIERWALQELYDHDDEHGVQILAWRAGHPESGRSLWDTLADDMAAQRAGLLIACLGLDTNTLISTPVMRQWTIKDLLAHVAFWDDVHTGRAELALAGREAEIVGVETDARNSELYVQRRDWSLEQALQAAIESRRHCLQIFGAASPEQWVRPIQLPWRTTSVWEWAWWRARHDAAHTQDIRAWRQDRYSPFSRGPRSVLRAAMEVARHDLLRQMEHIPVDERDTRRVTGDWTLKDLCGHIADWDLYALDGLKAARDARPLPVVAESDVESVNAQRREARRGQSFDQAWTDFHNTRAELIGMLAEWDDERLAREMDAPFDWARTAYGWFVGQTIWHDREHAEVLRAL